MHIQPSSATRRQQSRRTLICLITLLNGRYGMLPGAAGNIFACLGRVCGGKTPTTRFRICPTSSYHLYGISRQAPQVVEDQVTYPLTTAMLRCRIQGSARHFQFWRIVCVRHLRGWHRHLLGALRVLEYQLRRAIVEQCQARLARMQPELAGFINTSSRPKIAHSMNCVPSRLVLRYQLIAAHGVSEVASGRICEDLPSPLIRDVSKPTAYRSKRCRR